jgi:hypothetical protein
MRRHERRVAGGGLVQQKFVCLMSAGEPELQLAAGIKTYANRGVKWQTTP